MEKENKHKIKAVPQEISKKVQQINYDSANILFHKLKVHELKYISKKYGLKFSGTKKILIDRIVDLFNKTKPVVKIQSQFRRWIVQQSFLLRGPAFKQRKICVNDTDFVYMEPIEEIPHELFFSYKDSTKFVYGFNISSLIQILKKNLKTVNKIENPYTREMIDNPTTLQMLKLYRLCFIIYPDFKTNHEKYTYSTLVRTTPLIQRIIQPVNNINYFRHTENNLFDQYEPIIINNYQMSDDQYHRINRLREIRHMTIDQRVNNLFIEFDQLDNYTQANWFNLLRRNEYIVLYRTLYDIWFYRINFTREVRFNICPFLTPFYNAIDIRNINNNGNAVTFDEIKQLCLIVIENLVYTGHDQESRKLGAMHALSALTMVSVGARVSLTWLYESLL